MTRVLFVTAPERGHFHVLLGPAQALVKQGHEVAFWSPRALSLGGIPCFSGHGSDGGKSGAALAALLADRARRHAWIRALLLDSVESDLESVEDAVRAFSPDVIACDPMVYAAPIAAHRAHLPWVALSSSLNPVLPDHLDSELLATIRSLCADRDALFARHGMRLRFAGCDALSPHGTGVFTTRALAGETPPGVTLLGASRAQRHDDGVVPLLDGRPLVYLSLGSQNWHQPALLTRLFSLLAEAPVQVVAATGSLSIEAPPNVTLVRYADQPALLTRARLFVTHAGANSVFEGLDAGVPLLMTPLVNDQPHNAWFVERAGAGLVCDFSSAQLAALLGEGSVRDAASRIGKELRASDGARAAAQLVLDACR